VSARFDLPLSTETHWSGVARRYLRLLLLSSIIAAFFPCAAEPNPTLQPRYQEIYSTAKALWLANPSNVTHAWEYARATFDLAEFATNDTQRAQIAVEGINATRKALEIEADSAGAHYYLAMNLGQMARTQLLGALRLVEEMEHHFKRAAELDRHFDFAGPDRNLGILYREAPGWPASIGNKRKSREHLVRCVELHPEYPGNQLELLAAYLEWKESEAAQRILGGVAKSINGASSRFAGEAWQWSREDWNGMWRSLNNKLERSRR